MGRFYSLQHLVYWEVKLPRLAQGLAFVLLALAAVSGPWSGSVRAADQSVQDMLADRFLGKPDAPVTIIEYASLGCPHCRAFHTDTLPEVKKNYVETGKVRFIFRDFPLGDRALAASMIARCAGPVRYFALLELFFRDQAEWMRAPDGLGALKATAKKAGVSAAQVDACIRNEDLKQGLRRIAHEASQKQGINSTPSFVIEGEKVEGALGYKAFAEQIERALKAKAK